MNDENEFRSRMRAAYNQLVDSYAQVNHERMPEILAQHAARLAEMVGPGGKILDAGCGTGRDLIWFSMHGHWTAGIDLSPGMLAFASSALEKAGQVSRLVQADMSRMPFRTSSFQGVWACASLLHLPKADVPQAMGEFHRILDPEGWMVIEVQQGDGESWEAWSNTEVQRYFTRYQPDEISNLLRAANFEIVEAWVNRDGLKTWLAYLIKRST